MRSRRLASLGVLLGLVALPAFAQADGAPSSPPTTAVLSPFAPIRLEGANGANDSGSSISSTNWAGYAVTGSSFTSVLGSWIVPQFHCDKTPNSGSGVFVGIDGYNNNGDLKAIGTASNCVGTQTQYYAWYEFSPTRSGKITSVPVKTGDLIFAEVSYAGTEFTVMIHDITQGTFFTKSVVTTGAPRSSAEWIVGKIVAFTNLMDFGEVSSGFDYTSITDTDWATDSSVSGPISDFGSKKVKITMVTSGVTEATPTALTTDGSSFTVSWKHE